MVYHDEAGHTDGDSIVLFRRSDVLVAGDVFVTTSYPVIDLANGGGVQGVIDGLNRSARSGGAEARAGGRHLRHPRSRPRGRRSRRARVSRHGHHRPRPHPGRGQSRADARAGQGRAADARLRPPLRRDTGPWTTAMFIEAIYKDLSPKRAEPTQMRPTDSCDRVRRWLCGAAALAAAGREASGRRTACGAAAATDAAQPSRRSISPATGSSIVNEDWRWRMMTPPKGDYASVPLNAAGDARWPTAGTSRRSRTPTTPASRSASAASCACPGACTSRGRTTRR